MAASPITLANLGWRFEGWAERFREFLRFING
jgi:hypothetical protein